MDNLREYMALCWLNSDPLELPRSVGLFKKNLFIYFIIGYLLQANMIDDPFESFYDILFQTISMLFFIGIMLSMNKTLYAYVQIATAFIFSANVVSVFVVPVMVWLTVSENAYSYYLLFVMLAWYYAIIAYIVKHTLIINVPASMVVALFYFITTFIGSLALGQLV